MSLNSVLFEGNVKKIEPKKRITWLTVNSDNLTVTMFSNGNLAEEIAKKINVGNQIRIVGKLMPENLIHVTHLEYKGGCK